MRNLFSYSAATAQDNNATFFNNLIERIQSLRVSLDCVVNCIGQWGEQRYNDGFISGYEHSVFISNFIIPDILMQRFTPILLNQEFGRYVSIASIDARYPNLNSYTSTCSKSALVALSHLYRKKYKDTGVNFDIINPGGINTSMRKNKEDKSRIIQPIDIAKVCYFLACSNPYILFDDITITPKHFKYFE